MLLITEMRNEMRFEDFRKVFARKKIFDVQEVALVFPGFDRRRLSEWQQKGYIRKIINGYYFFPDADIDEDFIMRMANIIYPHSYISLETALSYYSIIPEAVYQVTSCSTRKTKTFNTSVASFSYHSVKSRLFFGYGLKKDVLIASPEKSLLDWLYFRHDFDLNDFTEMRFNTEILDQIIHNEKIKSYLKVIGSPALERRYEIFLEAVRNA